MTAVLATLCVTAVNLTTPLIIKSILKALRVGGDSQVVLVAITKWSALLLGLYLIRSAAQMASRYSSHAGGWRLVAHMRALTYDHLQKLSLRYFHERQTGQLLSRTVYDNANLESLVSHAIPDAITNVLLFAGVSVMLFTLHPSLALYCLIPLPFLILLVYRFNRVIRPVLRSAQAKLGDLNAVVAENLSGMKEVQVFSQEGRESGRVRRSAWDYTHGILESLKKTAFYHPAIELCAVVGTVVVIWAGARMAMRGELAVEDIVAFLLYLGMFYGPITAVGNIVETIQTSLAGAERVFEVLDTEPDIRDRPGAYPLPPVKGEIRFEGVSFAYTKTEKVLTDIHLSVKRGETLALVGATGVGKTTLISLLPRFYDPQEGRIFIDGHELRDVTLESLRRQVSLVLQDSFLFNGTIADNIRYGAREGCPDKEVVAAARAACAHEFIVQFKGGYQTLIGERGVKLSGGQKQRLAIARALLRDTPILILDEATSSVDSETEALIQEALSRLTRNRTTFVIAHRLSTVRKADKILVLDAKGIAEWGTHRALLKKGGLYAKLCRLQFRTGAG
jgi:ABC-type multidrug transport system fused ATPase/permease subunit